MEFGEFKEFLMRGLMEQEVIAVIQDALQENERVSYKKDALLEKYIAKVAQLESENKRLQEHIDLLKENEAKAIKLSDELDVYQSMFAPILRVIGTYDALSDNHKTALYGIFKSNDPAIFIVSGVQQSHIESLWEYIKIQIMKRQYADIDHMKDILYYFIHLYNDMKHAPTYEYLDTEPGELFDVETHIRTSESRASGKIQKVILQGLKNANTNVIIKKTVVLL